MNNFKGYPITKYTDEGKPLRYFTGKPCKKGHIADRYCAKGNTCLECSKEHSAKKRKAKKLPKEPKTVMFVTKWNPDGTPLRYTFWKKCINGHIAERRYSDNLCIQCELARCYKFRKTEKGVAMRVRGQAKATARNQKYLQTPKGKAYRRKANQLESTKKAIRTWQKTPKGIMSARIQAHNRRMQKLNQGYVPFTPEDVQSRFALFGNECAFCSSSDRLTMDHFIPLKHKGHHSISNIVPACFSCNVRKNAIMPHRWYKNQDFFSQEKWEFLIKNTEILDGVGYQGSFLGEYYDFNPPVPTDHGLDDCSYDIYEYEQSLHDYDENGDYYWDD